MKLYLEGPKAAQNDWFLLSTYLSTDECANIFRISGVISSATYTTVETFTYSTADYKLLLTSAVGAAGTATIEVDYYTE